MSNVRRKYPKLIVNEQPKSPISEKFRGIRSNILFASADDPIKSVVVTSDGPGSGKSTTSANLAISFAQAGYKTILIDGDMRKPTQHYLFKLPNNEGLSSLLLKWSDYESAIQSTHIEGLDVLTSGPIPPNPSELITSRSFKNMFDHISEKYNFVIIDTPPVNVVTDAQLFSNYTQHAVYVVNVESNNKEEVKKGKQLLEKSGSKIIGFVLNKAPQEKNSKYYAYYGDDKS
ncbi:polysaccharide biosynthesis tyrosine autokinase [Staphylococcus pasteuri]|uniref:polysaccharide biosynthesis tyrosine autokinase n=1 Tax=Staphylococcus pasteuri TaxID=45972 RepID=UPI001C3FB567|nr:polysaccharide biosynthesis tyrosine autokinase [Staphylococcus pasteuri]